MGLFGGPAEGVDPSLGLKLVVSESELKRAHKTLARNQAQIAADLAATGEELLMLAAGNFTLRDGILAVTTASSVAYVKGKRDKAIPHSDVYGTKLLQTPGGRMIVEIPTFKSELDFRPNDPKRYGHIIQMEVETERPAQEVCSTVGNITGRR